MAGPYSAAMGNAPPADWIRAGACPDASGTASRPPTAKDLALHLFCLRTFPYSTEIPRAAMVSRTVGFSFDDELELGNRSGARDSELGTRDTGLEIRSYEPEFTNRCRLSACHPLLRITEN